MALLVNNLGLIDACHVTCYIIPMIEGFRHKGLRRLFEDDDRRLLPPDMVERIGGILSALDAAKVIEDLRRPSFRLHQLKGDLKGFWAMTVRAIGGSFFASRMAGPSMSISLTTTE